MFFINEKRTYSVPTRWVGSIVRIVAFLKFNGIDVVDQVAEPDGSITLTVEIPVWSSV